MIFANYWFLNLLGRMLHFFPTTILRMLLKVEFWFAYQINGLAFSTKQCNIICKCFLNIFLVWNVALRQDYYARKDSLISPLLSLSLQHIAPRMISCHAFSLSLHIQLQINNFSFFKQIKMFSAKRWILCRVLLTGPVDCRVSLYDLCKSTRGNFCEGLKYMAIFPAL